MQTAASRALLLLCAACPETPPEALAELPVGRRDALLLTLREWAFGPQLKGLASCPSCANTLDLEFTTSDILLPAANGPATVAVEYAGADWTFRVPNSRDSPTKFAIHAPLIRWHGSNTAHYQLPTANHE